jgi:hypothetical protein
LSRQNKDDKQSVELFDGQKSLFLLLTGLIEDAKPKEQYLVFSINEENKNTQSNLFFRNLTLRRHSKKLDVKILKNIVDYKKELHTKLKIKYTKFNFPQGITIFRDNVIIVSWVDRPITIKIKSKVFADQYSRFFLDLWVDSRS